MIHQGAIFSRLEILKTKGVRWELRTSGDGDEYMFSAWIGGGTAHASTILKGSDPAKILAEGIMRVKEAGWLD